MLFIFLFYCFSFFAGGIKIPSRYMIKDGERIKKKKNVHRVRFSRVEYLFFYCMTCVHGKTRKAYIWLIFRYTSAVLGIRSLAHSVEGSFESSSATMVTFGSLFSCSLNTRVRGKQLRTLD